MKANRSTLLGLRLTAAAVLVVGSGLMAYGGSATHAPTSNRRDAAKPIAARAAKREAATNTIEVTGSRLKYRVQQPGQTPAGLNVTVIDPKTALNRGYSSPLEMLAKNPSVYRGR